MDELPFDDAVNVLPNSAGRRDAMRSLGTAGMALLVSLGLADVTSARKKRKKPTAKVGPAGPPGPAGPSVAAFMVQGASSPGLPVAAGSLVSSQAACAGPGKLVGGGYIVNGTVATLVNVLVVEAAPNAAADTYFATMRRTADQGSTAGAEIVAYAICIP